jgi:hypothetical protein
MHIHTHTYTHRSCGAIELVDFPRKAETKKYKFCFVTFGRAEDAQKATGVTLGLASGKSLGSITLSLQKRK